MFLIHKVNEIRLPPLGLTHHHLAMPLGNKKKNYLRGSFQFSIVTIQKNNPPPGNLLNYFGNPKLKIVYFNGKNPSNLS